MTDSPERAPAEKAPSTLLQPGDLAKSDLQQLEDIGVSPQEASRQLRVLASPPPPANLIRPCTVGDGVRVLSSQEQEQAVSTYQGAQDTGRVMKFVPASGAASRMFQQLLPILEEANQSALANSTLESWLARCGPTSGEADSLRRFFEELHRFAFYPPLMAAMGANALNEPADTALLPIRETLKTLLHPEGLGYAAAPKGLIPFHRYVAGPRTAFEEHLSEGAFYAKDAAGLCRLHFTVADAAKERFQSLETRIREDLRRNASSASPPLDFEIGYSIQSPASDTLALDASGRPFRLANGRLLLRPGGHGALLRNLEDTQGDIVFIKNIDNVVPDPSKETTIRWKRILGGHLIYLQQLVFDCLERWETSSSVPQEGLDLLVAHLGLDPQEIPEKSLRSSFCWNRLNRPLRVCGVVINTGEPGGGPFWIQGEEGSTSRQIVEMAQVDRQDPNQQEIAQAATHFNPVDLVCGLRDWQGTSFPLAKFSDPATAFVATKNHQGQPLTALEHPGLWNGAMAHWNTIFVEVPAETFAPVKTVFDLLRPEHMA